MNRMLPIVLFLALVCAGLAAQEKQGEQTLFDGRKLEDTLFRARFWKLEKSALEGSGLGNDLVGARTLGEGDFVLRARLELCERKNTGAAVLLGASRFGLDGDDSKPFLEGPLFGGKRTPLPEAQKAFAPGKAFELEVRRSGEKLAIQIDKTIVCERVVGAQGLGAFGFAPANGRLRLYRFSIEGNLQTAQYSRGSDLDGAVAAAVDRGIGYLVREQQRDGSWACNQRGFVTGQTALCVYTLLHAGLPLDHPAVARGLAFLDQNTPEETYSSGFALLAWEATLDPRYKERMQTVLAGLLESGRAGRWSYPEQPNDDGFTGWKGMPGNPDLSNIQYAALGLRAAAHAGLSVPDKVWSDLIDTVLRLQEEPSLVDVPLASGETGTGKLPIAGFRYWTGAGVSASMTAAGISVLSVARKELGPRATPKQVADVQRAVDLSIHWLGANFSLEENVGGDVRWRFYLLYGLERVGTLNELEKIGTHEWYSEGARWLLGNQSGDGSWTDARWATDNWHTHPRQYDTCFALLFLRRASRAVVRTAGPEQFAAPRPAPDPNEAVELRAGGRTSAVLFVGGFGRGTLERWGGGALGGLRVLRVEYVANGNVVASVPGNPRKGWTTEDYAVRHVFEQPGTYKVKARVLLVAPDAPADATESATSVESKEKTIVSDGTFEPWMELAAQARARNLLLGAGLNVTASSREEGGGAPGDAVDGLECTHWAASEKDGAPLISVQLAKPLKAASLVLGQANNTLALKGEYDRITRISVRLNKDKEAVEIGASDDELQPIVYSFGKPVLVSRFEVRILAREKGKRAGRAGFSEIALER